MGSSATGRAPGHLHADGHRAGIPGRQTQRLSGQRHPFRRNTLHGRHEVVHLLLSVEQPDGDHSWHAGP